MTPKERRIKEKNNTMTNFRKEVDKYIGLCLGNEATADAIVISLENLGSYMWLLVRRGYITCNEMSDRAAAYRLMAIERYEEGRSR